MKVLLLQNVAKIGRQGEVKEVSEGYAQNFLFPKKLAELATPTRIALMEKAKEFEVSEKQLRAELLAREVKKLDGASISITRKVNSSGSLFAGITAADINEAIRREQGIAIAENLIQLHEHIKHTGEHTVVVGGVHELPKVALTVKVLGQ
jgi:large subunit ribosomal protein L9